MTTVLHNLIDKGAPQEVVNERIVGLMEGHSRDIQRLTTLIETITGDHERRLRYLERAVAWALGATGVIGIGISVIMGLLKGRQ